MGHPATFPESNTVWKGWPAKKGREAVGDLPSFREGDRTISCWKLTPWERLRVLFTGRVWLHVIGNQPPVCVQGHYPFDRQ